MRLIQILLAALLFSGAAAGQAQSVASPTEPATSDVTALLDAYEEVYGFAGAAFVVANDSILYEGARGPAERGFDVANRPNTRFPINSVSKTFTAASVLALVADGTLDLHTPVAAYLPSLEAPWADRVTAHHLLSHTSGLPREYEVASWEAPSLTEQAQRVARVDLRFEPGTAYGYSNAGYALLGYLIEEVSGGSYRTYLRSRILNSAGLDHTDLLVGSTLVERLARPYATGPSGIAEVPRGKHLGINAGGGLYSTARDLYQWTRALEDGSVLPDSLQALLFTPHVEESGPNNLVGYGWTLKRNGNAVFRMAAGSGGGTKSAILHDPESGLFIAVLANWADVPILDLLRDLMFVATGTPVEPPTPDGLAAPADYATALGTYAFEPGVLGAALGVESDEVTLLGSNGRVYLTAPGTMAQLLRATADGGLTLTYTDELGIFFERTPAGLVEAAVIQINGQELYGQRMGRRAEP